MNMLNKSFVSITKYEKQKKLEQVLRSRQQGITSEQIAAILDAVDLKQQYAIKGLSSSKKFENMIVNEHIHLPEKQVYSETKLIYGDFVSGLYKNVDHVITNTVSKLNPTYPAAAIKRTKTIFHDATIVLNVLILYMP